MSLSSVIRYVRALDSAATDGSGKTGLVFGGITAKYNVQSGTLVALTTETITTLGTYQAPTSNSHIRIKEVNATDPTKGIYEVHLHNDQVAIAGKKLWLYLSAAGAAFQPLEIELDKVMAGDEMALINDAITAAKIAASAMNGKGDWNIGKTGYDLVAAWNAAKTAAQAGNQMDLINAPNITALTAIGAKLEAMMLDEADATALMAAISAKVEQFLINEGDVTATLQAIATAVWANVARSLTDKAGFSLAAPGPTVAEFNARTRLAAEYVTKLDGGYVDDFVYYWADGAAGQVSGVNGTIGNPVSNGVDMYALGVARGRKRFKLLKPLALLGAPNIFGNPAISFEGSHFDLNGCEVDFNADTSFAGDDLVINAYRVTTNTCVFRNGTIYHPSPSYGDYYIDVVLYHYGNTISPMHISGAYPPYFKNCGLPKKVQFQTDFDGPNRWSIWYYCYNFGFADAVEVDFNAKFVQLRISPWTGNLVFKGMTFDVDDVVSTVILHGYGKLTINDDCTAGIIQVTSHVEVFAQDGSAWVNGAGKPAVELVSSGSAGTGLTAQETRDAMKLAPSAGAAAELSVDDELAEIKEAIAAISGGSGAGAFEVNVTIQDDDSVIITDCDVILTTANDSPRSGVYATGITNASGIVTFFVDEGTLYVWRQKGGIDFADNPLTMVIDALGNVSIS